MVGYSCAGCGNPDCYDVRLFKKLSFLLADAAPPKPQPVDVWGRTEAHRLFEMLVWASDAAHKHAFEPGDDPSYWKRYLRDFAIQVKAAAVRGMDSTADAEARPHRTDADYEPNQDEEAAERRAHDDEILYGKNPFE